MVDAPFRYTKEFARESVAFLVRGGKKIVFKPRREAAQPAGAGPHAGRLHVRESPAVGALRASSPGSSAEANWRRIIEPWLQVLRVSRA